MWAQTCGHVFAHSSAHLGFITDGDVSLYPPRQLKMTTAERRVVVSDGLVSYPWVRSDSFPAVGFGLLVPDSRRKRKVISHLAFLGSFEAILLTPHTWGKDWARRPFPLWCFQLPRFRMFFQPGSCPPCFRALVSILGNSPIVKLVSRKFCFLLRTWKNKHNHCQIKKRKISRLCTLREEIKFKSLEQNPPELPLSSISSKSKLCFYICPSMWWQLGIEIVASFNQLSK